jgi:hypothetical protein
MTRPLFHVLLAMTGSVLCISAGKEPVFLISFHEEGQSIDGPKKVKQFAINGERRYFRLSPLFTQNNMTSYWPFQSEDGQTWGAVFWLDRTGQHVLERVGVANRGQFVAAAVNRVPLDVLYVDGQPKDNCIVIWKGLSPEIFKVIDASKKIKRRSDPSPVLAATAQPTDATSVAVGTSLVATPLPEGAVVSDIDPAILEAATADTPLNSKKEKQSGGWNPIKWLKKEKEPKAPKPALEPQRRSAPSAQSEAATEQPAVLPLPEIGAER